MRRQAERCEVAHDHGNVSYTVSVPAGPGQFRRMRRALASLRAEHGADVDAHVQAVSRRGMIVAWGPTVGGRAPEFWQLRHPKMPRDASFERRNSGARWTRSGKRDRSYPPVIFDPEAKVFRVWRWRRGRWRPARFKAAPRRYWSKPPRRRIALLAPAPAV